MVLITLKTHKMVITYSKRKGNDDGVINVVLVSDRERGGFEGWLSRLPVCFFQSSTGITFLLSKQKSGKERKGTYRYVCTEQ
jgi:hypothetical protein